MLSTCGFEQTEILKAKSKKSPPCGVWYQFIYPSPFILQVKITTAKNNHQAGSAAVSWCAFYHLDHVLRLQIYYVRYAHGGGFKQQNCATPLPLRQSSRIIPCWIKIEMRVSSSFFIRIDETPWAHIVLQLLSIKSWLIYVDLIAHIFIYFFSKRTLFNACWRTTIRIFNGQLNNHILVQVLIGFLALMP